MIIFLMVLHVVLLNVDEHVFNKNRSHSKYEIASVLTDGILFMFPLLMATFMKFDQSLVPAYKILAGISMASIVKNEYFYRDLDVWERLTHAALYVLHPILLFNFYESWQHNYFQHNPNFWMIQLVYLGFGIKSITYQLIYWNYIHDK